jgi:hypothetical protein
MYLNVRNRFTRQGLVQQSLHIRLYKCAHFDAGLVEIPDLQPLERLYSTEGNVGRPVH